VAFGVDSVTYYQFNVFSGPMDQYFGLFHVAGFFFVVFALVFPFLVRGIKRVYGLT
jgi:hypothetical protein